MARYVVEGIGYNDGKPFERFSTHDLDDAKKMLTEVRHDSPKIQHRLIEIIEE